ncbi:MAG: Na+/H+ antiporter subunit E [Desulfobulbaceae bacterium]|nr:Na+/H+ antiporter subunit E [Desulfobulbaceae bacterium]
MLNKNEEKNLPSNTDEIAQKTQSTLYFYPFLITFIIMFGVWMLLSGKFDPFHLSLGFISCAIVAFLSSDLLFPSPKMKGKLTVFLQWICYLPWLTIELFKANLHVAYLALHPRMMDLIDPRIIKFKSTLDSELALVTFANSITLTPGTITVNVSSDGDFKVHAIDKACADSLPGEMEIKISKVFRKV